MPQHDAVLVVNSESWDMQKQMTIFWENLLPGIQSAPLPENDSLLRKLKTDLATLAIPVTRGLHSAASSKKYNNTKVNFEPNEFGVTAMQFQFSGDGCKLMVDSSKGKMYIQSGWENWVTGKESTDYVFAISNRNPVPSKIAATATWTSDKTLQIDLKFVEAIHGDKITCVFDGNGVSVSLLNSVSEHTKNPEKRPPLKGAIL